MNLPKNVQVVDVCPRDGFQNVKDFIETEDKINIIKKLVDAGFKKIEITSFVSPKAIPQTRDAKEVVAAIKEYTKGKNVQLVALAPNERGAVDAANSGVDEITYVISASEAHNKANVNKTIEESMEVFKEFMKDKHGLRVKLGLATTFGCPFGEEVPTARIIDMAERALSYGADEIMLADTVGLGNPLMVDTRLTEILKVIPAEKISMHLHNTRGLSLANTLVGLQHGVTRFEAAAGGLGGCPFAPGAAGNVASEDLVYMLQGMGYDLGINMDILLEAVDLIKEKVNTPISSFVANVFKCSK